MLKVEKFDLLVSIYIFCIAVSELMGGKTFVFFHAGSFVLNASVGIFVVPIIYSINDVVTEVFGLNRGRSIVRSGIFVIFLILLFSLLAVKLPASARFLPTEKAYETIFSTSARIAFASLTAFALGDFLDVFLFAKIRQSTGKKYLWLRTNASNFISELVDTTVFIFLAFYAFDKGFGSNAAFLWSLIFPYWMLKNAMSIIETPFVYLGVWWLKEKEAK